MNATELEHRHRMMSDCIPPYLVSRLLELGHHEQVADQAGRGEWFCAYEWAQLLGEQGRQEQALEVLAPYAATGWWRAAKETAELLEEWGRGEEAIALTLPHAEAGDRNALEFVGRLLARHGRADEGLTLLAPHIDDWYLAAAMAQATQATGRADDAAKLLEACIQAGERCRCGSPTCLHVEIRPSNAIELLAGIRERQGRIDEAIAVLHTRESTSISGRDQLADLLARHDRITELRAYAAASPSDDATRCLAELLEARGDLNGAIALYPQQPEASTARRIHHAVQLAQLLARHNRGQEAIEVLRPLADTPDGSDDCIVPMMCKLFADHGRAADGLAYLDAAEARLLDEEGDFIGLRLWLMSQCGRHDEAIELARAHPDADTWRVADAVAAVLVDAGRTEQAITVLQAQLPATSSTLAWLLLDLGRVHDAITTVQRPAAPPGRSESNPAPGSNPGELL
ncbi:tetratricopeptide repeat protein [Actinomadura harenae]|uniref:tetratricopeptide repeat protein n=1 Tax=Actinomadura harenae TaxID=2483351 RepID=UPI0018F5E18F|nr:hypothetical protein [Actinomadura harenae]